MLDIGDGTVVVNLEHIDEDGEGLFDCTGLFAIERKVVDAFEAVVRATGHEIGEGAHGARHTGAEVHGNSMRTRT